eukprot:12733266-Alexandrium_andersonii.AAC.1
MHYPLGAGPPQAAQHRPNCARTRTLAIGASGVPEAPVGYGVGSPPAAVKSGSPGWRFPPLERRTLQQVAGQDGPLHRWRCANDILAQLHSACGFKVPS